MAAGPIGDCQPSLRCRRVASRRPTWVAGRGTVHWKRRTVHVRRRHADESHTFGAEPLPFQPRDPSAARSLGPAPWYSYGPEPCRYRDLSMAVACGEIEIMMLAIKAEVSDQSAKAFP